MLHGKERAGSEQEGAASFSSMLVNLEGMHVSELRRWISQ